VTSGPQRRLSHLDEHGAAHMVDVTDKVATVRTAVATGTVHTTAEVIALITSGGLPIPLCHPLALTGVDVDFAVGGSEIELTASVRTTDRTGVEMEALTAVSVAALTVYDMIKAVDPGARLEGIRVLRKEGGKTGLWTRES
jgi:cyclic pyranopterin phosphate synthase